MRVLVTGRGTSGSWQIRGVQLGAAIGADVVSNAPSAAGYDIAVLVKRQRGDLVRRMQGVPLIWDVVDSWPQPEGNRWDRERCMQWLREQVASIKPAGIVAATRQMADDCQEFGVPVLALPHHARPGLKRNPIREQVQVVAYEGGLQYLGRWMGVVEAECIRRGWRFVTNHGALANADIVVALRDCDGYAARALKSNVKLANAQGSGTPVVCCREAGYLETATGAECWADTDAELRDSLDALSSHEARKAASETLFAGTPALEAIAGKYRQWLQSKF